MKKHYRFSPEDWWKFAVFSLGKEGEREVGEQIIINTRSVRISRVACSTREWEGYFIGGLQDITILTTETGQFVRRSVKASAPNPLRKQVELKLKIWNLELGREERRKTENAMEQCFGLSITSDQVNGDTSGTGAVSNYDDSARVTAELSTKKKRKFNLRILISSGSDLRIGCFVGSTSMRKVDHEYQHSNPFRHLH